MRVDDLRSAVDGVKPATGLGTLNAVLWLAGFLGIGLFARLALGGDGRLWFLGALGATAVVAKLWPWTRAKVEQRLTVPSP